MPRVGIWVHVLFRSTEGNQDLPVEDFSNPLTCASWWAWNVKEKLLACSQAELCNFCGWVAREKIMSDRERISTIGLLMIPCKEAVGRKRSLIRSFSKLFSCRYHRDHQQRERQDGISRRFQLLHRYFLRRGPIEKCRLWGENWLFLKFPLVM